ncbi:ATP-binding protein [Mycoplasma sp. 1012]
MNNKFIIGNVILIEGSKIVILTKENTNQENYVFNGKIYNGVSIGNYLGIIRGSNKIIVRIEKEFLEDKIKNNLNHEFSPNRFERKLEVKIIGNLSEQKFEFGIKHFPMIFNEVVLLSDEEINQIYQFGNQSNNESFAIGTILNNDIKFWLNWNNLFNTHMGIFGNTGSGKSNTLTKIYTELFNLQNSSYSFDKSKFVILDFNGEYIKDNVLSKHKKVINLAETSNDKITLTNNFFWNEDTLSIIYSATEKTQKPFIKKSVENFLNEKKEFFTEEKISEKIKEIAEKITQKQSFGLLWKLMQMRKIDFNYEKESFEKYKFEGNFLEEWKWGKQKNFTFNEKLKIAVLYSLIKETNYNKNFNFEYIQPLLHRIDTNSVGNFLEINNNTITDLKILNIISFKNAKPEIKKMFPLLIVKQLYEEHKTKMIKGNKIESTIHLIIDEAHNILSEQATREDSSWKDYRLDIFEEIIKEGRKFGFFITLSSQRPSDISSTIMSQLHNYFIHRLVNEQDLRMISNTVSSLDSVSKSRIPNLSSGQCVIAGTSFRMPLLIQVDKLEEDKQPDSSNVNLTELWKKEEKI